MTAEHKIRLHAAWKRIDRAVESGEEFGANDTTTVSLPDATLGSLVVHHVTFQRRFNRPTGLSDSDTVVLQCGLLTVAQEIVFNGVSIPIPTEPTLDISSHLLPHNELRVIIAADQFQVASQASAALEITHTD
jgi:hypothetical protein